MRSEREAIAVCSRIPEMEWDVGFQRAAIDHFYTHASVERNKDQQQHHRQGNKLQEESTLDCKRMTEHTSSCSNVSQHEAADQCEKSESLGVLKEAAHSVREISSQPDPLEGVNASKLKVGYALRTKKTQSFIQPALLALARSKGITLAAIDRNRPLGEQGHFDVILHKLMTENWSEQLEAYKLRYPEVLVIDPPEAIKQVFNRQLMLQEVAALNFCHPQGKIGVPKQIVVDCDSASISKKVAEAGLKFPLVAKPKFIDGTANAHALSLAFNESCLSELKPPLVLQEFINHGGVLFKVYVIGHLVKVVRRFSLPDVCEKEPSGNGVIPFPRVSSAAASADGADLDPDVKELPPEEMLESLSSQLRSKLGLNLFNLDIIREGGKGSQYYVIDVNYFPGYGKMPDYEELFTEFLLSLAEKKPKCTP